MTDETGDTTRGFSDKEDTEIWHFTHQSPHATLPSSTSGKVESELRFIGPSGEAVGTSSDVSSPTSSEVTHFIEFSDSDDKEAIPLANTEESDSPLWLNEWEKPEGETRSAIGSSVTGTSESSYIYTKSPETGTDPNSESATNYRSDSSTDFYFMVSAEATCATCVEIKPLQHSLLESASWKSSKFLEILF